MKSRYRKKLFQKNLLGLCDISLDDIYFIFLLYLHIVYIFDYLIII